MLSTLDLLDLAKHRQGDVTDYRLSKLLGVSTQNISHWRNKGVKPSNPVAMRLGKLAGMDPLRAVALINLERASSDEDRELWEAILERLSHATKGRKTS